MGLDWSYKKTTGAYKELIKIKIFANCVVNTMLEWFI